MIDVEEDPSLPTVPDDVFSDKHLETQRFANSASTGQTWGLHLYRRTPDLKALRRLLEVRYHITRDDVPHEDIFAP